MANVRLEHIYKVYPNGTKAVSDFTMDIKDKEFIVFVGPSGCGKSTTLRMIAGLEDISAGELYIDDNLSELKYQKEDVIRSITNTFYLELESGFHRGGVYFGDYVLVNAYKFYDHFKITEDNLLDYSINVASKNELGEEIVTMHHYTLNNLGIIVNLETKSINKKTKEQVITTITTVINQNVDKIWGL